MPVPAGWKDIGGILTSPNGVTTKGAVREHILAHDWGGDDWLLSPMTAAVQPDPLDSNSGAGYVQITREHLVVSIRPVAPATTWKTYTRFAGEAGLALARRRAATIAAMAPKRPAALSGYQSESVKATLRLFGIVSCGPADQN